MAHLFGVFSVVTADAVDPVDGEALFGTVYEGRDHWSWVEDILNTWFHDIFKFSIS